ncbi:DUF7573 domain-containing protein [Halorubrum sp. DTA46]|uniref:DUF7573 domain-containing protein n=1 Tax=Halorubrum sp. DTA46 TaxID=3402162 RepID=UPI003AB07676
MTEDRSLDDFAAANDDPAPDDTEDTEDTDDDSPTDALATGGSETDGVEPAVSTATWTTGGADCDRCGDRVERLWRDDGAVVCIDCKDW